MTMKRDIRLLSFIAGALLLAGPVHAQIISSVHDLSATGPGRIKAPAESEICFFCHTPHTSLPSSARWNRSGAAPIYTPYWSSTLDAVPGQPTNASKLCLSCHDGTIALGQVLSRASPVAMTGRLSRSTNLTTDLSDDHPVSFDYDLALASADGELVDPRTLRGSVKLDENGQLQCTSCHHAHSSDFPKLLVADPAYSLLCLSCHDKDGWEGSAHESSPRTWNGVGNDPWPHTDERTVAENACENCHNPHGAGSYDRLLNNLAEEDNCLSCHSGTVARLDIGAEVRKGYGHHVDTSLGVHDPVEQFTTMPRHVECSDCHDPHAATRLHASAPDASGALFGAAGVTAGGVPIDDVLFEYEVCFRCHSDGANARTPAIPRTVFEPNVRMKLDPANPSHHAVVAPGANPDVPSLKPPLNEASVIYCTDCHNNDDGPGAGGMGPRGPHGSVWPFMLERSYETADNTPESFQAYALCYKCHDRSSILSDQGFSKHSVHLATAPCSSCHDPHGVRAVGSGDQTHLINFDKSVVLPDPDSGRLEFIDTGFRSGECWLQCHGTDHRGLGYVQ
jgi:predicted CXXCH cytochrome family protein